MADNRTRNQFILLVPVSELPSVTAEAAGSSPVVPAIFLKELSDVTPKTPTHNPTHSFY